MYVYISDPALLPDLQDFLREPGEPRARAASPQQSPGDRERECREGGGLSEPELALERATSEKAAVEARAEARRDKGQVDASGDDDRSDDTASRRARACDSPPCHRDEEK